MAQVGRDEPWWVLSTIEAPDGRMVTVLHRDHAGVGIGLLPFGERNPLVRRQLLEAYCRTALPEAWRLTQKT